MLNHKSAWHFTWKNSSVGLNHFILKVFQYKNWKKIAILFFNLLAHTVVYTSQICYIFLQIQSYNGSIPLGGMDVSHSRLHICHPTNQLLCSSLTTHFDRRTLWAWKYVLVCIWYIHKLFHFFWKKVLEQWKYGFNTHVYW